MKKSDIA